jgi:hypothetical protein
VTWHAFSAAAALERRMMPPACALLLTDLQVEISAKLFDLAELLAAVQRAEGRLG